VKRMVPAVGKDWNDRLLAEQNPTSQVEQPDRQMFKALWKWYRVAGEVGHQESYRKRITEVAREVADGKGLSEKAAEAIAKDLQGLEKDSQPVVVPAVVVPTQVATAVARGTEAGM
jgi:hypothetical protein